MSKISSDPYEALAQLRIEVLVQTRVVSLQELLDPRLNGWWNASADEEILSMLFDDISALFAKRE